MAYDPMGVLFEALRMDNRLAQAHAAYLLGELGRPSAVGPLLDYVCYSRWHGKTAGFHALARIGDRSVCPAIRPLVDLPNSSDDWYWYGCKSVRAAAAVALLALGDESGEEYLTSLAERNDDVFYAWFAPALLRLPDEPPAAARFKARLTVDCLAGEGARGTRKVEPGVMAMVAEALGIIGGDDACRALLGFMGFHSRYVRGQAVVSLLAAAPTDEHVAAARDMADGDETDFARIKAALALARTGRDERLAQLREMAEGCEDPFDTAVALQALGEVGRAEDVDRVAGHLGCDDPYVRQMAIEALERIDAEGAAQRVQPLRDDPDIGVRLQAAKLYAALNGGQNS